MAVAASSKSKLNLVKFHALSVIMQTFQTYINYFTEDTFLEMELKYEMLRGIFIQAGFTCYTKINSSFLETTKCNNATEEKNVRAAILTLPASVQEFHVESALSEKKRLLIIQPFSISRNVQQSKSRFKQKNAESQVTCICLRKGDTKALCF